MPSPFPGMDPYLENTYRWRGFHGHFISQMTFALNSLLPEGMVAQYEERCYILPLDDYIYPDSLVIQAPDSEPSSVATVPATTSSVAETRPLVIKYAPQEVHEPYIEIITADDTERVITVIELLSPTNKSIGTGREEYTLKQSRVLSSHSHLLEIDLLHGGEHTVAVRRGSIAAKKRFDYLVSLHRAENQGTQFEVWPFTVREHLPVIRVPLQSGMPDVLLDLQPIFNEVYDRSGVRSRLHYNDEPEPPLTPLDAVWADAVLREKGLRP